MGFAGGYLLKHASGQRLIREDPDPGLNLIVIIPCYNESGLQKSLDSLFLCNTSGIKAEIIIFINASENSPQDILNQNIEAYQNTAEWINEHPHKALRFHLIIDNAIPGKDAGVGLARKTLMDEAVRRFNMLDKPDGIILSMDADTLVETDYLVNIDAHFRANPKSDGCSIYFEHALGGSEFSNEVYRAIASYELHLRYYVRATAYTGYPHAFHTVGSCFGVRALRYCQQGGMNKRTGGEDFYFIQKVAQNGRFTNCTSTRIKPSPRPSDRVPFGTGPAVSRMLENPGQALMTYNPESFLILGNFFRSVRQHYEMDFEKDSERDSGRDSERDFERDSGRDSGRGSGRGSGRDSGRGSGRGSELSDYNPARYRIHPILKDYLIDINFTDALAEIRANSASLQTFMKRFWRYFNMFRILKFLHFARDNGIPDIPVEDAAAILLTKMNIGNEVSGDHRSEASGGLESEISGDLVELLKLYRKLDRGIISYPLQ